MVLFRRTGRIYGGIHILVAPPSGGKSYMATLISREIFMEGKRRIYSNYPIRTRDGKHCSYVWEPSLMHENLSGHVIILDEAHKYYWSRDFKSFTQADKDWWSTTGHNEVTVYVLTQELARIDCIITDKATMIWDIEKIQIPILEIPICFRVTQWPSKEAYSAASKGMLAKPPIAVKYMFFNQSVADMYDTHFFKSSFGPEYIGIRWDEYILKKDGVQMKPPYPTLVQRGGLVFDHFYTLSINKLTVLYNNMKRRKEQIWKEIGDRFDKGREKDIDTDQFSDSKIEQSTYESDHDG